MKKIKQLKEKLFSKFINRKYTLSEKIMKIMFGGIIGGISFMIINLLTIEINKEPAAAITFSIILSAFISFFYYMVMRSKNKIINKIENEGKLSELIQYTIKKGFVEKDMNSGIYCLSSDLMKELERKNISKELFDEVIKTIKEELTEEEFENIFKREDIKEEISSNNFAMENGSFVLMLLDISAQIIADRKNCAEKNKKAKIYYNVLNNNEVLKKKEKILV